MVYSYLALLCMLYIPGVLCQWEKCLPCNCLFYDEYWRAYCDRNQTDTQFDKIPSFISSEVKELWMNHQPLRTLPDQAFAKVGLVNLLYLFLVQCQLTYVDETAFANITNLVELDISNNNISFLAKDTFSPITKLKRLRMHDNKIGSISNGLLLSLTLLEALDLSNNRIYRLESNVFPQSKTLSCLKLSHNNMTYMNTSTIEHLNLRSLELYENPWICDCRLRNLQEIIKRRQVSYTESPTCAFPSVLSNKKWSDVISEEFNCWLYIMYPRQCSVISMHDQSNDNVTLPCLITSSPSARVKWCFNNATIQGSAKYKFTFAPVDKVTFWYNLTLTNVGYHDRGEYKCSVKNIVGVQELITQLGVNQDNYEFGVINRWVVLVSITCIIFIGSVVVMFVKCFVRYSSMNNLEYEFQESREQRASAMMT